HRGSHRLGRHAHSGNLDRAAGRHLRAGRDRDLRRDPGQDRAGASAPPARQAAALKQRSVYMQRPGQLGRASSCGLATIARNLCGTSGVLGPAGAFLWQSTGCVPHHTGVIPRVVFTLVLACTLATAQTSNWISLGPDGGDVRSLAYDPRNPDRIFLGTSAGQLYLSKDGGSSWSRLAQLGDDDDYVLDNIAVDPQAPNTIYVAAWSIVRNHGDLFRSRDGGRTWQGLPGMQGKSMRALALAPSDPRILVAGALDGVFRSDDGGDTWRRISPATHGEIKNIESLAIDPRTPDI